MCRLRSGFMDILSAGLCLSLGTVGGRCFAAGVLLHYFNPDGWEGWALSRRPVIRQGMPVLVDDDLLFEDGAGPLCSA
jgi:hypothetical protein